VTSDGTTPPQTPDERSWAPETGWPSAEPPAAESTPAWAEPLADEDESEYDAWLDAQDPPAADDTADGPVDEADPAAAEEAAAATVPNAAAAPVEAAPVEAGEDAEPGALDQEAFEEQASQLPTADEQPPQEAVATAPFEPEAAAELVEAELEPDAEAEPVEPDAEVEPVEPGTDAEVQPVQPEVDAELATETETETEVEPVEVAAPVVVPDPMEAAATPLAISEPEPAAEEPAPLEAEPEPALEGLAAAAEVPATRSGVALVASLAAVAVLLAALTAFLAVWSSRTSGGGALEDARRDALSAARSASRLLFSYDYRHLDKDFAAGKAVTTGTFASDYARTTSKIVDDVAPRYKAVVVADVSEAAVISATESKVQVLVFVTQRSTSTLAAGQKLTQSRLTMTLENKHGRWLVSKVSAF
jgi:Mce-associated membrane protein